MYLLEIFYGNSRLNKSGKFRFRQYKHTLPKWTRLPSGNKNQELLRLMALACGGVTFLPHLPYPLKNMCGHPHDPLHLEYKLSYHYPQDSRTKMITTGGAGLQIDHKGQVKPLPRNHFHYLTSDIPISRNKLGQGNTPHFFLAYGKELTVHEGTDDFQYLNPFFRITRFHSLFSNTVNLTDPVAFLSRLHYRAILKSRFPAVKTINSLVGLLKQYLDIDISLIMEKKCDFQVIWSLLRPYQKRALIPILDITRHMLDAFPHSGEPLGMPGLLLLDRPDRYITAAYFPSWIRLIDAMLPAMQFVITLSEKAVTRFPKNVGKKRLALPLLPKQKNIKKEPKYKPGDIVLLDIDSRLPNLALMKLSQYYKDQGKHVFLTRKETYLSNVEEVYASCVFSLPSSQKRMEKLRQYYGKSLKLGGSGVNLTLRLPKKIENLPSDYSLYPELEDRAIGFLTRGCPYKCPFCIVPTKEGNTRQVTDLKTLLGNRKKLVLLDDNMLSHPKAGDFLEEIASRDVKVNFTQTLDLRLLSREKAKLIKNIYCANTRFTRRVYHFSLNDARHLDEVRSKYELLDFSPGDNVEFVCMYGYNTTLSDDVERFRFLRTLPGAYVFVQEYQPIPGGPESDLPNFFDGNTDALIDELVGIVFKQNMKSMEKYYRWLSTRYVKTFGKLHDRLVDTIFRYNQRDKKGYYITTMAGTVNVS